MTYCLNPKCRHPENSIDQTQCAACGFSLIKLRDRYRVSQALAHGGFGATFLANDEGLPGEPICVIKQLRPSVNEPNVFQMARDLFEREAKTLGRIGNHPQIPRLLDYFEQDNQFYLVQEYINGATLQQEVKRYGAFSEAGVKQFLSEVLPILQYIHDQRVIHRDIKPANLIRRVEDCKLVMIDFGAVKNEVNNTINNSESLYTTVTSYAVGTAGFAPPEQIALRPVYASDIYAVGVTCIYLLTGKSPKDFDYHPSTGEMLWEQKVRVSDSLTKVLKTMLEVSVRHRYKSASEVLSAIQLEPYEDSLASSMASHRKPFSGNDKSGFLDRSSPPEGYNPSIVQMATSIRERRIKSIETNPKSSINLPQEPKTKAWKAKPTKSSAPPLSKNPPVARIDSNTLLSAYIDGRRDFAMQDLSTLDLERADLTEVNFHGCKLHKTNLHKAILFNSDLGQASLNQASLKDANLSKAYLSHADLEGADLRGADLSDAYLNHANLRGANLSGANLTNAKVSEEQLAMAKLNWMTIRPNGKRAVL